MDDQPLAELKARIADLERKVDWLYRHSGYGSAYPLEPIPDGGVSQQILDLVRRGRKIEAIKVYREQTGVGLKEAKDVIDRLS